MHKLLPFVNSNTTHSTFSRQLIQMFIMNGSFILKRLQTNQVENSHGTSTNQLETSHESILVKYHSLFNIQIFINPVPMFATFSLQILGKSIFKCVGSFISSQWYPPSGYYGTIQNAFTTQVKLNKNFLVEQHELNHCWKWTILKSCTS